MAARRTFFLSVLGLLAAANVFGLWLGVTQRAALIGQWPRLEALWPFYLACPMASLGGLWALWLRQKTGFWICLGVAVLACGIELHACGPALHTLRIPVATLLLAAAVWPVWRELIG